MNYLLDTCTISDLFKRLPSVLIHFSRVKPNQVHISTISVMEVEYGLILNPERAKKLRPTWSALLAHTQVVPFSHESALKAASIRAYLKNRGLSIGHYDVLLAGVALAHELTIVTSNVSEFTRVDGIVIEDWRS